MALGDDIRPFPDLEKAYQAYADALGLPVQSLSDQERRQAVLSAVLEGRETPTTAAPDTITQEEANQIFKNEVLERLTTNGPFELAE